MYVVTQTKSVMMRVAIVVQSEGTIHVPSVLEGKVWVQYSVGMYSICV